MTYVDAPRVVPTTALGRRFRSTTEARWAVFMDALGLHFEYEPETYDLGPIGWYLPDFWIPGIGVFLEVKPTRPKLLDVEYDKARGLHIATRKPVVVASGFGMPGDDMYVHQGEPGWLYDIFSSNDGIDSAGAGGSEHNFAACRCGLVEISAFGFGTGCRGKAGVHGWDTERIRDAYVAGLRFRPDERTRPWR